MLVGVEPTSTGLQPVAGPSGSSISETTISAAGCPTGFEPALRDPQSRVLPLHHGHHQTVRKHQFRRQVKIAKPSSRHRVDRRGVAPRSPACKAGVVLLDQQPRNNHKNQE